MNYIHSLQSRVAVLSKKIEKRDEAIAQLVGYLQSAKFASENWVNVGDVLLRIHQWYNEADFAAMQEAEEEGIEVEW